MTKQKYPIVIGIIDVTGEARLSRVLKYLILQQNVLQKSFEFVFLPKPEDTDVLEHLETNKVVNRGNVEKQLSKFIPNYLKWVKNDAKEFDLNCSKCDHIVLISLVKFSDYYYLIGDDDWDLIALGYWQEQMAPPSLVEFILSSVLACSVGYSFGKNDVPQHQETKGCLFDFTSDLDDARYWVLTGFICKKCEEKIELLHSEQFRDDVILLLKRDWLGTTVQPSEISNTVRKLGYNMFRTKGIRPSIRERLSTLIESEFIKVIFAIILAGILLILGLK